MGELNLIEGRGAYWRSSFEDGTDLIPPDSHWGYFGQSHIRREHIRGQVESKE